MSSAEYAHKFEACSRIMALGRNLCRWKNVNNREKQGAGWRRPVRTGLAHQPAIFCQIQLLSAEFVFGSRVILNVALPLILNVCSCRVRESVTVSFASCRECALHRALCIAL